MSSTSLRQSVLRPVRRVVIKLGTQLLTKPNLVNSDLDLTYINSIVRQIAMLRREKFEVTLVSSGAVGAGCAELAIKRRPKDLAELQAVAAVGQPRLMMHYHRSFERAQIKMAQLLLTRDDFEHRLRFLNIRNCITHLQKLGCVPIVNENDTVAVEELEAPRFGENDVLAAMICHALRADALVLLTVIEGLEDEAGQRIDVVEDLAAVQGVVRHEKSPLGSGGMKAKLRAAKMVTDAGEVAIIANGRTKNVLPRLFDGEPLGTLFLPSARKLDSRQRWIGLTKRPSGVVTIDAGASTALRQRSKSLLAVGIVDASGKFERGQVVVLCDQSGREVARGLINYDAAELRLIMGKRSNQFPKILGHQTYAEVVHRDNLVLTRSNQANL